MHKILLCCVLFAVSLCLAMPASADFCDPMPQLVIDDQRNQHYHDLSEIADYIEVVLPDGTKLGFSITTSGSMDGYVFESEGFHSYWQISPVDGLWDIAFRRHDTLTPRPDGSFYPDAIGFDLVNLKNGDYIAYHYDGESVNVCGWRKIDDYAGHAMVAGNELTYYPDGSAMPDASFLLDDALRRWLGDFDELPGTPQTAEHLVAIMESSADDLFPGYTLRSFNSYNHGYDTSASYSKIEDGCLYIKRTSFEAGFGAVASTSCLPIPLSESLLKRLETEPFEDLISTDEASEVFRVDDALDLDRVPVAGLIIQADAQEKSLILLTKLDQDTTKLHIVTLEDGVYSVASSKPLPGDVYMDVFHGGDGEISLEWNGQAQQAAFHRLADGSWQLEWVMNSGEQNFDYSYSYCGLVQDWSCGGMDGIYIGSLPADMANVLTTDLKQLPDTEESLHSLMITEGWAVVNNPDPNDRLHLRVQPKRSAESLGKFYNGTPVQVHEVDGDWCRVSIGLDGHLEGWMMRQYLAFGAQMEEVDCVFPQLVLKDEWRDASAYADPSMKEHPFHRIQGALWIAGVVEDELYIVLTPLGETGYMPQEWFWAGNG